ECAVAISGVPIPAARILVLRKRIELDQAAAPLRNSKGAWRGMRAMECGRDSQNGAGVAVRRSSWRLDGPQGWVCRSSCDAARFSEEGGTVGRDFRFRRNSE